MYTEYLVTFRLKADDFQIALDDDKLQQSFVWFRLKLLMQGIENRPGVTWTKYIALMPLTHADKFIDMISDRYKEVISQPFSGSDLVWLILHFKVF